MKDYQRKNTIFVFLIILLVSSVAYAEQIKLFVGDGHNYDNVTRGLVDTTYKLIYDKESDEYYFYTSDSVTSGWIVFNEAISKQFYENLLKYQEWEEQAVNSQVEIQKELPNSPLVGAARWKTDGGTHSGENIEMNFIFLSQSENLHHLVITTTTIKSTVSGAFFNLEPLYLTSEQVGAMAAKISPEAIEKTVAIYGQFQ